MIKKGVWRKIVAFFGFDEEEEGIDQFSEIKQNGKVVNFGQQKKNIQILVLDPVSFEEVRKITDYLKEQRPIVLNLDKTDKDQAKRIIDFISGATYALQGNMQKIGEGIFLFAPKEIGISGQEISDHNFWRENWKKDKA